MQTKIFTALAVIAFVLVPAPAALAQCPDLTWDPAPGSDLPDATVGQVYSTQITVSGDPDDSYYWQFFSGTLPPGIDWNPKGAGGDTLTVSGTPSDGSAGRWNFQFGANSDTGQCIGEGSSYALEVLEGGGGGEAPPECQSDPSAVCGTGGDDNLQGTPEDDTIYAGEGNDSIDGGGGNDTIVGGGGDDVISGGPGNDILKGDTTTASPARQPGVLFSTLQETAPGADILDGGDGDDSLDGNAGNDQLTGGVGADSVLGSEGNDKVAGAAANDDVAGGPGADQVLGQGGNDKLQGNGGPDVLKGGGGVNDFNGGPGRDVCVLNNSNDRTASCEKKKRNFKRNFLPAKLPD